MKDVGMDQLVKMEIGLLRKLSKLSPHFPHFRSSGTVDGLRYVVMDLLGLSLAEIQLCLPHERFTISTALRVGLQLVNVSLSNHQLNVFQAIEVMHSIYFLHRDIKPGNMAVGYADSRKVYLIDFGLARRFVQKNPNTGKLDFRLERIKAPCKFNCV